MKTLAIAAVAGLALTTAAFGATKPRPAQVAQAATTEFKHKEERAIYISAMVAAVEQVCETMVGNMEIVTALMQEAGLADRLRRDDPQIRAMFMEKTEAMVRGFSIDKNHECPTIWRKFGRNGDTFPDLVLERRK